MEKVEQSIDLGKMTTLIQKQQEDFWYVDRRARILKFKIVILKNHKNNFNRVNKVVVSCYHMLKNKTLFTNEKYTSGTFFDKYQAKGHFFTNPNDAVKYMNTRVQTDRNDIVKSASTFISDHPEYLI